MPHPLFIFCSRAIEYLNKKWGGGPGGSERRRVRGVGIWSVFWNFKQWERKKTGQGWFSKYRSFKIKLFLSKSVLSKINHSCNSFWVLFCQFQRSDFQLILFQFHLSKIKFHFWENTFYNNQKHIVNFKIKSVFGILTSLPPFQNNLLCRKLWGIVTLNSWVGWGGD